MGWQWSASLLAVWVIGPLIGAEADRPVQDRARALFASGRIQEAATLVQAVPGSDTNPKLVCLWGEIQFRRGDFEEAAEAFEHSSRLDTNYARAWWGLGRIEEIHFRREQARELFLKAYQLDPRDTDIILSYLDGVTDPQARRVLLQNLVALSRRADPERAAWAVAQMDIDERLSGKSAGRLVSPYVPYRVALAPFQPTGVRQDGLIVPVRVNGGKPLRLVLDTGARATVIDARVARSLGLEPIVESRLKGFGDTEAGESQVVLARQVAIGAAQFEDCLIEVSRRRITGAADGVLSLSLLQKFRVRVDAKVRMMELTPGEENWTGNDPVPQTVGQRNLFLVKTTVADKSGWFLLDSGAAYSTVSRDLAPPILQKGAEDLIGVTGTLNSAYRLGALRLGVGGRELLDLTPVALDLQPLSQREGIEISGVLGYPVLSRRPFTVDFQRGAVAFE